jgi:hypothetical protein
MQNAGRDLSLITVNSSQVRFLPAQLSLVLAYALSHRAGEFQRTPTAVAIAMSTGPDN